MFLKPYSSATVKSSGGKNKSTIFTYIVTFKNASHSNFLWNTKLNVAIDIKGWG